MNKLESKSKKCIFIGFIKSVRVSDFGIPREGATLPIEMWSLTKNQCCKKNQRQRIKHVAPRSCEYGDVTATYIRRSEIFSRIYAKHPYRQESECGSTVVIYILTEKYKYMVITENDTILQEYYITRKYKST